DVLLAAADCNALAMVSAKSSASWLIARSAQTASALSGVPSVAASSWPNTVLDIGPCTASIGPLTLYWLGGGGLPPPPPPPPPVLPGSAAPPPPPHAASASVAAEAVVTRNFLNIVDSVRNWGNAV